MEYSRENLASRLREERERVNLSTNALAEKMGIARPTQASYESGATSPSYEYLRELEKVGIDANYVMNGDRRNEYHIVHTRDFDVLWDALEVTLRVADVHTQRYSKRMLVDSMFYLFKNMLSDRAESKENNKEARIETAG